jgi:hypothetical protein
MMQPLPRWSFGPPVLLALLIGLAALLLAVPSAHAKKSLPSPVRWAQLSTLHPTQAAIGLREVETKRREIEDKSPQRLERYLVKHPIPAIIGPGHKLFIIDHHHLGLALWLAKIPAAVIDVKADLSALAPGDFWRQMEADGAVRLRDAEGRPIEPSQLPATLSEMKDDPYRSLAGSIRDAGGYAKTRAPFAEFAWADFLRTRIPADLVSSNYEAAMRQALVLAHGPEAHHLPGYTPN